jgi:hypothetical protein
MISEDNQTPQLPQTDVKCRFFAQYWEQNVLRTNEFPNVPLQINSDTIFDRVYNNNTFLMLKPLSKITDDDALEVANIISRTIDDSISKELVTYYKEDVLNNPEIFPYASYSTVDYMRSKGYAVSYMEYSVENLVSFGWVRLV